MGISVKLEAFEGPLDLLLHLIDKNKVNIYDIPIVMITEQYMEYVNGMSRQDLNLISEFLVMAATLLNIKSKMLLPAKQDLAEDEVDPRQELVERLLEYKMYKYMSVELKNRQQDASRILFKISTVSEDIEEYKEEVNLEELLGNLTLLKLHTIFKSIIKKQEDKIDPIRSKFGKIEKEEVNLSERMEFIEEYAGQRKKFSFRELLEQFCGKMNIIVTFLGVLELMKMGKIQISQDNLFDDIMIVAI